MAPTLVRADDLGLLRYLEKTIHEPCISSFEVKQSTELRNKNSILFDYLRFQKAKTEFTKRLNSDSNFLPSPDQVESLEQYLAFSESLANSKNDSPLKWLERASEKDLAVIRSSFSAKNWHQLARAWAKLSLAFHQDIAMQSKSRWSKELQRASRKLWGFSVENRINEKIEQEILESRLVFAAEVIGLNSNSGFELDHRNSQRTRFLKISQKMFGGLKKTLTLFSTSAAAIFFPGWIPFEWLEIGRSDSVSSTDIWFRLLMQNGQSLSWELSSRLHAEFYRDAFFETTLFRLKRVMAVWVLAVLALHVNEWSDQYSAIQKISVPVSRETIQKFEQENFDPQKIRLQQIDHWMKGYERFHRSRLSIPPSEEFPWALSPHRENLNEFKNKMNKMPDEALRIYALAE